VNRSITNNLLAVLLFLVPVGIPIFSLGQVNNQNTTGNKFPATHLSFNNDTNKIQFAIVADLWGGYRPGIFEDAVTKLELLQPQFVLSVGDLIDGKTYDSTVVDEQWKDFDQKVKPLSMPFFYVPGNHDIGNPMMEKEWKKRFGRAYYYFIYKNTLFLTINTEDGGKSGISEEQVAYFKKILAENAGVRWTFLFMHRPVWFGDKEKKEGYEKIEAALQGRNYTLFSGHHHTYSMMVQNGNKHFILGSTGGGSDLRGEKFGEYDHITLVTLDKSAPKIVNLKLEGIIKEDVVNANTYPLTQTLINQDWLSPVPFVSEHQKEKNIKVEVLFSNPTSSPLKVSGQLCPLKGYTIYPCAIDLTIAPNSEKVQPLILSKKDKSLIDLSSLTSLPIVLDGEYVYKGVSYKLPASKELLLSWKLVPPVFKKTVTAAHTFHGIDTSGMIALTTPEYLDRKWYWSGPEDGLLRFKMNSDEKFVYLTTLITDDQWVTNDPTQKDLLYLHLEDAKGGQNLITFSPDTDKMTIEGKGSLTLKDISVTKHFDGSLFLATFKIPVTQLKKKDHSVRINIGFRDQDNLPEKQFSIIFWKPVWGTPGDYKNSGSFLLN
jgi:predicted phosphodiesterase